MQRIAAIACLIVLPACASTGGGEVAETRTERATVAVEVPGTVSSTLELSRDAAIVSYALAQTPERAWPLLVQTYADLEIPVSTADESGRTLAATHQKVKRIGGRPMTVFFRCSGAYENLAATGDVYVSARTQLAPGESGGTQARTEVSAWAQSRTGSRATCASTGILERTIGEKLREVAASARS